MSEEVKSFQIGKMLLTTSSICLVSIAGIIVGLVIGTFVEKKVVKSLPYQHQYRIFSNRFYSKLIEI